jgi:hypothetical protein
MPHGKWQNPSYTRVLGPAFAFRVFLRFFALFQHVGPREPLHRCGRADFCSGLTGSRRAKSGIAVAIAGFVQRRYLATLGERTPSRPVQRFPSVIAAATARGRTMKQWVAFVLCTGVIVRGHRIALGAMLALATLARTVRAQAPAAVDAGRRRWSSTG